MKIVTSESSWGWTAVDDDTYDGPGSLIGLGKTEDSAIKDLVEQIENRWEKEHDREA